MEPSGLSEDKRSLHNTLDPEEVGTEQVCVPGPSREPELLLGGKGANVGCTEAAGVGTPGASLASGDSRISDLSASHPPKLMKSCARPIC